MDIHTTSELKGSIKITVLGHCDEQFENIKEREFLDFRKLQDLTCSPSEYQNNIFGEARAYFCEDLFPNEVEFVGTVTASWNYKYSGKNKIDEFDKWESAKRLFSEESIILCANVMRADAWITSVRNLLRHIGFLRYKEIIELIKKEVGEIPIAGDSWEAPLSNQIITSRTIFLDKRKFICYNIDILNGEFKRNPELFEMDSDLSRPRFMAYLSEFLSVLWYFQNHEKYTIIPNETLKGDWYNPRYMRQKQFFNKFSVRRRGLRDV